MEVDRDILNKVMGAVQWNSISEFTSLLQRKLGLGARANGIKATGAADRGHYLNVEHIPTYRTAWGIFSRNREDISW